VGVDPDIVAKDDATDTSSNEKSAGGADAGPSLPTGGPHDDASAGDADPETACTPVAGNLLENPSFELGSAGWHVRGTPVARTDGPKHCKKFLEVEFHEKWDSITQYLDLSSITDGSDGGTKQKIALDFAVSVRSLDDNGSPVNVAFRNDDGGSDVAYLDSKSLFSGQWVTVSGSILITPRPGFAFSIGSEHIRKIGIDHAWIAVQK
jgi:hypothetical protein